MWKDLIRRVALRYADSQYEVDLREQKKFTEASKRAFRKLYRDTEFFAEEAIFDFTEEPKRAGSAFVKSMHDYNPMTKFLDKYVGTDDGQRRRVIYLLRDAHLKPDFNLNEAVEKVSNYAFFHYRKVELGKSQQTLREAVPEDFLTYLPENIVVDIDDDGHIARLSDRFGNKRETIESKVNSIKDLVGRYNSIVRKVRQDLKSGDEKVKLSALVTALLMETGIRPGRRGNKVVKVQNGEDIEIETFGALTLGHKHVNFIRDNFVYLEFQGKKNKTNLAMITDKEVIKVLMDYADRALGGDLDYIFETMDGQQFTYPMWKSYFNHRVFKNIKPVDFRRLQATSTILENLYAEQKNLYVTINQFVEDEVKDLKAKITAEVKATVEKAVRDAQRALSHESFRNTVDYYADPNVILRFLSQGYVENSLKSAILTERPRLQFDPEIFMQRALQSKRSSPIFRYGSSMNRVSNLKDLLDDLEVSMTENGISF